MLFIFFLFEGTLRRRGRGGRRLQVVALEEALEVEDLELIRLRQREELAQGRIGLDDLLDHQIVLARVLADARRHLRAGQQGALGQRQERAERVRDRRRLREDRVLLGLGRLALHHRGAAAAALGRLLQLTRQLLLELLDGREHSAELRAERVHLLEDLVELRDDVDLLGGGDRRRGGGNGGRGGDDGGRDDGGGDDRGRNGGGRGGNGGLLGSTGLRGRGSGRHCSYD